jgi:hypothetical protein
MIRMDKKMIGLVLLLLAGISVAIWWFFIREKDEATVSLEDATGMVGNIYGTVSLSAMYEFIDSTTVKHVQMDRPCVTLAWELKTPTTLEISGKGVFTIQPDSIKSSDGTEYIKLDGSVTSYCNLIGKNV